MKSGNRKSAISSRFVSILIVIALSGMLTTIPIGQCANAQTVGLWHLDELEPSDYMVTTPDARGYNHGTVGGEPYPVLVEGKFDKALDFNQGSFVYVPIRFLVGFPPTPEPVYIPVSPNLDVQKELKIEAWIKVKEITDATYNNIVVKVTRTGPEIEDVTRVFGLAVKPSPDHYDKGVLSGCVFTDSNGFNEILTTEPVVSLNQWMKVAFTRTSTGMHLYVNGEEQDVKIIDGVQNPMGSIINGTEVYIGHDSEVIIDEVKISDLAPEEALSAQIDIGNNTLIAIIVAVVAFASAWVLRKFLQTWVIYSKSRN